MDLHTYVSIDATEIAQLIRNKEVTIKEIVEFSLQQLETVNPTINAVTHERKEKILLEAEQLNINELPFNGVPILLKDLSQAIKGEPLTSGSKLFKTNVAEEDSNFAKKFREAGFLFLGHTNSPEFGLKNITEPELFGPSRNPWNKNYSPGGSSGGAAAAVASGIVPIAGASDGGGSIRIPASFSGLVGLKPTRGRTPVGPGVGRQWHGAAIDFVLTRTVRDSAAMLQLLQVVQPEAAFQTPLFTDDYRETMKQPFKRKLRIAFSTKSPVETPVSEDAIKAVEKTVKWLEKEGHHIEEKANNVDGVQLMKNYYLMNSGEISSLISRLETTLGRAITPNDVEIETWLLNEAGKSVSAAEFSASIATWDVAAAEMVRFHETYDLFITPATAYPAPKVGKLTHTKASQDQLREKIKVANGSEKQDVIWDMFLPSLTYTPFTQLANLTGQPAISLPVYVTEEGLPLGIQVMAPKGMEYLLLQVAYQIEQSEIWNGMKGNPYFK